MEEKIIHCPICETPTDARAFLQTYISPYNNQEYKMYECSNCQVQWWEPLKMIPEFYESEVFEHYITFHMTTKINLGENHKAFFRYFPSDIKGNLLDVGCGDGRFIRYAKEYGYEVWGIDFDKKSVENVKKNFEINTVFAMSLEEFYKYAKEKGLQFDVITFFEVLEHQDKPKEFLKMIKELLKNEGYIAGSVPNRNRLFAEIDWKYYPGDYPPHHFLRFSKESLQKALTMNSFTNVKIFTTDYPYKEIFHHLEKKIFGNVENLKYKIKSWVTREEKLAKVFAIEELNHVISYKNKLKFFLIKSLKMLRNFFLLPFSFFYLPKLKQNGINLYFHAKKQEI